MSMPLRKLSNSERKILLNIARTAIENAVTGKSVEIVTKKEYTPILNENGASFVTLTIGGKLRGCIGTLEAYQPLASDVAEHAVAAAFNDFRFPPLSQDELDDIEIEISYLSNPEKLEYKDAEDLIRKIRPGVDGVVLKDGLQKATFLPQVWEKLPNPRDFLDHLCYKMNQIPETWRYKNLDVALYQVETFHE
jgi:AmmeMemoRadiSam system protein A